VKTLVTTPRGNARDSSVERSFLCLPVHDRERSHWKTVRLEAVKARYRRSFGIPERESSGRQERLADGALVSTPKLETA
jgi:hypothetical protein